jgi:RNase adaptor protein for sRNA GlmZ degradation
VTAVAARRQDGGETLVHGTCIAVDTPRGPMAILLKGPSGSGKSDLALRMIDAGAKLIADDQVVLERQGGLLLAGAPDALAGASEVRGFGIAEVASIARAPLALVARLVRDAEIERLPDGGSLNLLGIEVPVLDIDPFTLSAPAKLRLATKARSAAIVPPGKGEVRAGEPAMKETDAAAPPDSSSAKPLPVVLVTGLSGAGRVTALKALEDIGYESIDNLPLSLLDQAISQGHLDRAVAVGLDIRGRDFAVAPLLEQFDRLVANPSLDITLLFIDCDDEVLQRRFTETRRRHPLAQERPLLDGIAHERRLLAPLRDRCTLLADTSETTAAEFRHFVANHLALDDGPGMGFFVTSFSFRHGLPREADIVLDVRFLRNPHYEKELRPLTGRDPVVAAYVEADPAFAAFFSGLVGMLEPLLPHYEREGKSYLTIAIGCTGGRHRSVAIAEELGRTLKRAKGIQLRVRHRDISED